MSLLFLFKFLVGEVDFLRYKLGQSTISIDPDRIKALIDALIPKSATDIKGLSGGLGMVLTFEPKIAEGMVPLNPLSNGKKFAWDESHSKALASLKDILTETLKDPKNYRPDPTLPFILETDASNFALGAVLFQEHPSAKDEEKKMETTTEGD